MEEDKYKDRQEQYKKTYRESISASKRRIRRMTAEGTEEERRLGFIVDLARARGYNMLTLGKACGLGQQMTTWILSVRDNCNLSKARVILAGMDLGLEVELAQEERRTGTGTGGVNVQVIIDRSAVPAGRNDIPAWFADLADESHPLHFLYAFYMSLSPAPASMNAFCRKILTSHDDGTRTQFVPRTLMYYVSKKDVPVRFIYDMAKAYGAKITWKVYPVRTGLRKKPY